MMSDGMNAYGTALERMGDSPDGGTTPGEFEAIANVTNVSGPGIERETIETTAHKRPGEPDAGWRTFIGGLKDAGEVSLDVNYVPEIHDFLLADLEDGDARSFRLVFPDAASTMWEFKAILTGYEPEFPYDDKAEASLTFKVTGRPNFSAS